jgi:parallel beta-helix repeat protein
LVVLHSVSIRCPSGTCTIDAGSISGNLFTLSGGYTPDVGMYRLTLRQSSTNTNYISGVWVTNGHANLDQTVVTGFRNYGFYATGGDPQNLQKSTFTNCYVGVLLDNSAYADLGSNTISNNSGAGLYLGNWANAQSESNTFKGNGAGVQLTYGAAFNDHGSSLSNNSGAGLYVGGGSFYLDASTVSGNKDRGIYMRQSTTGHAYYSTIDGNSTSGDGAGLCLLSDGGGGTAFAEFFQCTFSNNKAGGNGGGMYISGTANAYNCTISSNTAARGGGAYDFVASTNSYLKFVQSTVAFNQATISGGGVVNVRGNGVDDVGFFQTIVARNSAPMHPDLSGLNKGAYSFFGDLTGSLGDHSDDITPPGDPLLGPLMDSPGRLKVKTHALLKGSRAKNKVIGASQYNYDGRGFPRQDANWDVGAYEDGPFETESLTVISSKGWHTQQQDQAFSNGAGTVMRSGVVDNYVTYAVAIPEALPAPGLKYTIEVRARKGPDGAIIELATAPASPEFTTIGTMDLYGPVSKDTTVTKEFSFTSAAIKHFRFRITGKNNNSLGHFAMFDYIRITKK